MDRDSELYQYFKHRKLRVDILTLFLSLFAISFALVISFAYLKNKKSILQFSKGEMERVSAVIVERISGLVSNVQFLPEVTSGIVENIDSLNNKELTSYMLDVIKFYPKIYAFYVGSPDGNYIEVSNLTLVHQTHYLSDVLKPLPKGAIYSLRYINRTQGNPSEHWEYKNENLETVAEEDIPSLTYDHRSRPWYSGAKNTGALFWMDVYSFSTTGMPGITVANPVFNASGKMSAVIGVDLTLSFFEKFLGAQKIGKSGKAFILNRSGEVIIPMAQPLQTSREEISPETISAAFAQFSKEQTKDFIFQSNGVDYLAYFNPFPVAFGREWLITIIVPLNDFFADIFRTQKQVSLISLAILIVSGLVVVYFAKKISDPIVVLAREVDKIRQLELESKLRVHSNIKEIQVMDASIASMRAAMLSFGRYVPKEIVKQLITKEHGITLGGEKREITVFFSDIAGFTTIAETMSTEILMELLTDYFGPLSEIILKNGGTIDKYIGDSIMAFWNAPLETAQHPYKACEAALKCEAALVKINQNLKDKNMPQLPTRIGINTGKAFIGNIGTPERLNYTAIGDVVNTGQRLEQAGKDYHVSIVISENVLEKIDDAFVVRPLDFVAVKGRKEKIKIYELMGKKEGQFAATPEEVQLSKTFTEAYDTFYRGELDKAKTLFQAILQKYPQDFPTQLYLNRIHSQK